MAEVELWPLMMRVPIVVDEEEADPFLAEGCTGMTSFSRSVCSHTALLLRVRTRKALPSLASPRTFHRPFHPVFYVQTGARGERKVSFTCLFHPRVDLLRPSSPFALRPRVNLGCKASNRTSHQVNP